MIAFASFCGSVAIFLKLQKRNVLRLPIQSEDETVEVKQIFGRALLTLTAFAAVMLAYISFQYKIGEMGSPSGTALPFRIKGLIFYARIICVPLILLFSIYLLDRSDDFRWSRVGIMILLLNGIVDMFLRNSRSSLLLALLLIGFLIFVNGVRLRHKEKVFLGAVALFALFMVPIMTEYRHMRTALKLSQFNAILAVFEHTGGNWIQQLADAIKFVLFRMPGIESLWCQLALGARPLGLHSFEIIRSTNGIAGYLTFAIHPMKLGDNTLLAPGFVGWLYMVGGAPIIILGSSIIGFITVYIWKLLAVIFTNSYVIAKVFLLWMLFIALTEGTLDSMGLMITAGITTIIFVEVLVRRLFRIVVI
ncbi:MAG: hypothetical protein H7240_03900 [Glaciimonas sp.]|nr:hypothetical protein [Glaciimonas sp.]